MTEADKHRIRPSLLEGTHPRVHGHPLGCIRFTADVLLHESIHQYMLEVAGNPEPSYHGHGPGFTAWCNLIGAAYGLPAVVTRNRQGSDLPRSAQWPHNVRPAGYYLGAYEEVSPPEETPPPEPEPPAIPCPRCGGSGRIPEETR